MNSNNQVTIFGGQLRSKSSSVSGGWTINAIEQLQVDIAFIDQTIIKHSLKNYIVADTTKFSRDSLYKICDWSDITALITNKEVDNQLVEELEKQTSVIIC